MSSKGGTAIKLGRFGGNEQEACWIEGYRDPDGAWI